MAAKPRERFTGRIAVVMSMAGAAIGLGNIWRFPYMVGENGGAAFIIIYILCSIFIALPIFYAEAILGKASGCDTFGALEKAAPGSKLKWAGYLTILASFIVLSFYSVVGGWSIDYLIRACNGGFQGKSIEQASQIFTQMSAAGLEPIVCTIIFLILTTLIVIGGVNKGIGLFSKVMMPLLFLMIVLIVVRSVTLPGANTGIEYLLKPDFSKINGRAIAAALGQSFFSLSLGVGVVLTYSSYMREEQNVFYAGLWTAIFDTLFALLAGFAIMPAVFASGLEPGAGPSLVYETLPAIFSQMGTLVPVIFFLAIVVAALTSSISMLEVVVAWLVDQKGFSRLGACAITFAAACVLATLCTVFPKVFNACDFATSNVLMMIGAFVFALAVGWKMDKVDVRTQFTNYGTSNKSKAVFPVVYFLIKWVAPVMIVAIAVSNFL